MADLEALKREKEIALTCYQQIRYAKVKTEEDVKVALQRYLSACDAYNDAIEKLF